jgi:hypothetical protein
MRAGVHITVIYVDAHLQQLRVQASNGRFSGQADLYANKDVAVEVAVALRGFPSSTSDERTIELGALNETHAGGGVRVRFRCTGSAGHAVAEILIRGDSSGSETEAGEARLHVPVEASAIDAFVRQLQRFEAKVGCEANLDAPLAGRRAD